jgi:hypothetical protein
LLESYSGGFGGEESERCGMLDGHRMPSKPLEEVEMFVKGESEPQWLSWRL